MGYRHRSRASEARACNLQTDQRVLLSVPALGREHPVAQVSQVLGDVAGVAEIRCHEPSASVWVRLCPQQVQAAALPAVLGRHGVPARLVRLGAAA